MNCQGFFAVAIFILCHLVVSLASKGSDNENGNKYDTISDQEEFCKQFLEACVTDTLFSDSQGGNEQGNDEKNVDGKLDKPFSESSTSISPSDNNENIAQQINSGSPNELHSYIYEYKPPKEEENCKLGFSTVKWRATGKGLQIRASFTEVQAIDQKLDPSPKSQSREVRPFLTFTMKGGTTAKNLKVEKAKNVILIIGYFEAEEFRIISFKDDYLREVELTRISTGYPNEKGTTNEKGTILMGTIQANSADGIFVYSGPKREFKSTLEILELWNSTKLLSNDESLQMLMLTLGEPSKDPSPFDKIKSDPKFLKEFFFLQRWFYQNPKFVHETLDPDHAGSRKFRFRFRDLPNVDFSRLQSFSSHVFSVVLSNSKVCIADTDRPNIRIQFILDGVFLTFSREGTVPFLMYLYRKGKLEKQSDYKKQFTLKLQANDEILIATKDHHHSSIREYLESNHSYDFLSLLSSRTPLIRINIREQSSDLKQLSIYHTPLIPLQSGVRIVNFTCISSDRKRALDGIGFNDTGVISGNFIDPVDIGYARTEEMKAYVANFTNGKFSQEPGCIAIIEQNGEESQIVLYFNISPKSSFIILKRSKVKNDSGSKGRFLTNEINWGDAMSQERRTFPLVEGDCFEIYESKDPKALMTLWKLYSRDDGGDDNELEKIKDFFESLSLENNIMRFTFTLGKAEEFKSVPVETVKETIHNNITTQQWFGGALMETGKPKIELVKVVDEDAVKPCEFSWGYSGKEAWCVNYESYVITMYHNHLFITFKLDDGRSILDLKLSGYVLRVEIHGTVPFTLAVYRGDVNIISWSGPTSCDFDDFEVGDKIVLIPWTFFLKSEEFSTDPTTNIREFFPRLNSSNLVATIVEHGPSNQKQ